MEATKVGIEAIGFEPGVLLLTADAAARVLGIGRTTLYALLRRGVIHSVAIGRARRIHIDEVRRIAAEGLAEFAE